MALALGCDNGPASESIIDRAFAQGQRDGEDWRGLLIARVVTPDAVAATGAATAAQRERGPLVGAILARILAGNVASVGVPRVTVDAPEGTDALLATHAVRFARQERAAFAQTLLEGDDQDKFLSLVYEGLRLVEGDTLGGSGSRGYGQVKFQVNAVLERKAEDYRTGEDASALEGHRIPPEFQQAA